MWRQEQKVIKGQHLNFNISVCPSLKKNIYFFSCAWSWLQHMGCISLWHVGFWLWHVGSSSLTRHWTWVLCIGSSGLEVLATGPPGKSPAPLFSFLSHSVSSSLPLLLSLSLSLQLPPFPHHLFPLHFSFFSLILKDATICLICLRLNKVLGWDIKM